jgi:hypothetical protein
MKFELAITRRPFRRDDMRFQPKCQIPRDEIMILNCFSFLLKTVPDISHLGSCASPPGTSFCWYPWEEHEQHINEEENPKSTIQMQILQTRHPSLCKIASSIDMSVVVRKKVLARSCWQQGHPLQVW